MPKREKRKNNDTSFNSGKLPLVKQSKLNITYSSQDHQVVRRSTRRQVETLYGSCDDTFRKCGTQSKNKEKPSKRKTHKKQSSSINLGKSPQFKQTKLNFTPTQSTMQLTKNRKDIKRNVSDARCDNTFKKYGMYVPSYEDILNEKKNCDNYNDVVDNLMELISPLPILEKFTLENQNSDIKIQDCKKLSLEELRTIFKNNIEYLDEIQEEKIFCQRHNMYRNNVPTENFTFNSSMILFTNEQKQTLACLLSETYGNSPVLTDYYFKVLLPELCLKIYIDEYGITYEDAVGYLNNYPAVVKA